MAISFGAISTGGTNKFKVGYDWSGWSAVSSGSASVTGTISFYVNNQFAVSGDVQQFDYTFAGATVSGLLRNSPTVTASANTNTLISTRTVTYNYSTWGSSPGNFSGTIAGSLIVGVVSVLLESVWVLSKSTDSVSLIKSFLRLGILYTANGKCNSVSRNLIYIDFAISRYNY